MRRDERATSLMYVARRRRCGWLVGWLFACLRHGVVHTLSNCGWCKVGLASEKKEASVANKYPFIGGNVGCKGVEAWVVAGLACMKQ
ncbi:hypothetical protein F4780DRAFT_720647 [Xylariomycetidae sp. FL0641]|nr:hypothetical protein F4780DRAFT_720647 [Xylariomycetidae sp. FL0641]